jgi:hypothetical protein
MSRYRRFAVLVSLRSQRSIAWFRFKHQAQSFIENARYTKVQALNF